MGGVALGMLASQQWAANVPHSQGPKPFYGGPDSAIRPDLSQPSASGERLFWRADTRERVIALTFDDGPMPDWTPKVLSALADEEVRATFFLRGDHVVAHGDLHRASVGHHELGNHTYSHPDLSTLTYARVTDEIARCTDAMTTAYGLAPTLFRPPYGHLGGSTVLAAAEANLTTILWSAQFRESHYVQRPADIAAAVARDVGPGTVVLGHDTGGATRLVAIDQLRAIIARLRTDGYTFVTVSELLAIKAERGQ